VIGAKVNIAAHLPKKQFIFQNKKFIQLIVSKLSHRVV